MPFVPRKCDYRYVGFTQNSLSKRLTQHLQQGSIRNHFIDHHNATLTREIIVNNTKIIEQAKDRYNLAIKEALLIMNTNPVINKQYDNFSNILRLNAHRINTIVRRQSTNNNAPAILPSIHQDHPENNSTAINDNIDNQSTSNNTPAIMPSIHQDHPGNNSTAINENIEPSPNISLTSVSPIIHERIARLLASNRNNNQAQNNKNTPVSHRLRSRCLV